MFSRSRRVRRFQPVMDVLALRLAPSDLGMAPIMDEDPSLFSDVSYQDEEPVTYQLPEPVSLTCYPELTPQPIIEDNPLLWELI